MIAARPEREERTSEPETRRLPRPVSLPLPLAWRLDAGVYVHASGDSIETFAEFDDAELQSLHERFGDSIALVTWEQCERAVRRVCALTAGAEVEA